MSSPGSTPCLAARRLPETRLRRRDVCRGSVGSLRRNGWRQRVGRGGEQPLVVVVLVVVVVVVAIEVGVAVVVVVLVLVVGVVVLVVIVVVVVVV